MDHAQRLGEEQILKLLVRFSLPAIVGMTAQALYNIIDRVFIGRAAGSLGIAGITVAFPFMLLLVAVGTLIGVGANALVSLRLGARQKDAADLIFGNAITLLFATFALMTVLGLVLINPLLRFFGATDTILPYARAYMQIILGGAIFQGVGLGLNTFIRGEGNPKIAMLTMLLGVGLNTLLAPICISWLGWGIRGAAIATVIAQIVSALWIWQYFLSGQSVLVIRREYLRLQWPIVRQILAIGAAPASMMVTASLLNLTFNHQLSIYGGDVAVSAIGIINGVFMLILLPIFGISQGVQPIIGYNYGAEKLKRVKQALQQAIFAATGVALLGFLATQLFTAPLIRLFSPEADLIALGSEGLRVFVLMMPLLGFQVVSSDYFYAVGKPKRAMFLVVLKQGLLLIPFLLIFPRFFGLPGIWAAAPAADLCAVMVTAIWFVRELRQLVPKRTESPILA